MSQKTLKTLGRKSVARQFAALPFRHLGDGTLQVMLLTSRGTGRWVIPKGWPMRRGVKRTPAASAAREAYEEAGLKGRIERKAVGSYSYEKRPEQGASFSVRVAVFRLEVKRQVKTWPEKGQRQTLWCFPEQAAAMVDEPELAALLRGIAGPDSGSSSTASA